MTQKATNIHHRAVLFHVQSEDSGRAHPHVITHLYYGGSILQSRKSGYADQLEATDLPAVVKALMEKQHKAVLKSLVHGEFDDVIRERLGPEVFSDAGDSRAETQPVAPQVNGAACAPCQRARGRAVVLCAAARDHDRFELAASSASSTVAFQPPRGRAPERQRADDRC